MALKFGSPAWRKKYAPKKRKNAKRKRRSTAKRKTTRRASARRKTTNPRRRKNSAATRVTRRNPPRTVFQARYKGQNLGSYDTKAEANRAIARARREEKDEKKWEAKMRKEMGIR